MIGKVRNTYTLHSHNALYITKEKTKEIIPFHQLPTSRTIRDLEHLRLDSSKDDPRFHIPTMYVKNVCILIRNLSLKICLLLQNFKSIPHVYESNVGYYGGSVALADYCPYIQEFTWRSNNVVVRGSHCMYEENNPSKLIANK